MADAVRTVFLGRLPPDVTERELHLLFYEGGGCEAINLRPPKAGASPGSVAEKYSGFVQFTSRERAEHAVQICNHMVFDPTTSPHTLISAEMARQNFRGLSAPAAVMPAAMPAKGGQKRALAPEPVARLGRSTPAPAPKRPASVAKDQCTLFMGGLGEHVRKAELHEYAALQEGLVSVSMKDEGTPRAVGWAVYCTPDHAATAMFVLEDQPLPSLGKPPNIQPAKVTDIQGPAPGLPPAQKGAGKAAKGPPGRPARPAPAAPAAGGGSCTLFLGGMDACVTEEELAALGMTQPGFSRVSLRPSGAVGGLGRERATAWLVFNSHEEADMARMALKEVEIPSMGRPGNVEFARADARS